jgi:signal transduction histidine kinase
MKPALPFRRIPRRTVRLRLTLVYGGLFLMSGAALLAVTYFLVVHATTGFIFKGQNGASAGMSAVASSKRPRTPAATTFAVSDGLHSQPPPGPSPEQLQAQAEHQHSAELHTLLVQSGVALAAMSVLSIGLGWVVAGRVLRPLRRITTAARDISASNLHERLALDGPEDELKELGDTFDDLLGRLEGSFEAQRRFVANASHELRTPLARQKTLIQVALTDPQPTIESLRATHERVLATGAQQERLIDALLTLARGQAGSQRRDHFDLADLTDRVVQGRQSEAKGRDLQIQTALAPALVCGDQRLVEQLVANLVDNAIRHNVTNGQISIVTGTYAGRAVVTVANTGPVVPEGSMDRLFQPFQRLRPDRTGHGRGVGLGLSIVQAIADAHAATVTAYPRPGGGLDVQASFPRQNQELGELAHTPSRDRERSTPSGQRAPGRTGGSRSCV